MSSAPIINLLNQRHSQDAANFIKERKVIPRTVRRYGQRETANIYIVQQATWQKEHELDLKIVTSNSSRNANTKRAPKLSHFVDGRDCVHLLIAIWRAMYTLMTFDYYVYIICLPKAILSGSLLTEFMKTLKSNFSWWLKRIASYEGSRWLQPAVKAAGDFGQLWRQQVTSASYEGSRWLLQLWRQQVISICYEGNR